jgi:hypothetical protein
VFSVASSNFAPTFVNDTSMLATLPGALTNTLWSASSTFQPSGRVMVKAPLLCEKGWLESVIGAAPESVGTSVGCSASVAVGLAGLVAVGFTGAVVAEAFGFCVGRGTGVAVGSGEPPLQARTAKARMTGTIHTNRASLLNIFASNGYR